MPRKQHAVAFELAKQRRDGIVQRGGVSARQVGAPALALEQGIADEEEIPYRKQVLPGV